MVRLRSGTRVPYVMHRGQRVSMTERTLRVLIGFGFLGWGLFVLNHSFYSFWLASGPPNDYPEVWYQQGIISGSYAVALFTCGVCCQFYLSKLKSSYIFWFVLFLVAIGLAYPYSKEWLLIDACLDGGGSWSQKYFRCENA